MIGSGAGRVWASSPAARRRRPLATVMAVAVGLAVPVGAVAAAGPAAAGPAPARIGELQTQQPPMIEDVKPADTAVAVTVVVGDTRAGPVRYVTVSARAVDDVGNPIGPVVSTGVAPSPDRGNPVVVTVPGLVNDTDYAFTATETSGGGTSSPSDPPFIGGPVTPSVPLAPTLDSLFGRTGSLLVSWNPAADGGSPVTGYTVTATPNGPGPAVMVLAGTATSATVGGLRDGMSYTVSVTATNRVGTGRPGFSDAETVGAAPDGTATPQPAYAAGPPIDVSAGPPPANPDGSQPDPTALAVSWDPPTDDGGSANTGYTVTATAPGRPTVSTSVAAGVTEARLTGLVRDIDYAVTVRGQSAAGLAGKRTGSRVAAVQASSAPVAAATGPIADARTVLLSAAAISAITSVTDGTVEFSNPPAQVQSLAVQAIIVAGQNSNPLVQAGLLRTVDAIARNGTTWTFTTSTALLTQAFEHLSLTASGNDHQFAQARIHLLDPRFRASAITGSKVLNIDLAEKIKNDPRVEKLPAGTTLTALLRAELSLSAVATATAAWAEDPNASWYDPTSWKTFTYDFVAKATAKASVSGEIGIAYTTESKKTALFTAEPATKCFWVYVVAFCPKLTVYTQTSIDGSIKFSFNATYERTVGGEVRRDASGRQSTINLTTDPPCLTDPAKCFSYSLQAKAELIISFPIDLQILIYELVGPELTVTPSLVLTADTAANPWLRLDAKLKVDVFFVVDLKVKEFKFGGTVYPPAGADGTVNLWKSAGGFTAPALSGGAAGLAAGVATRPVTSRPLHAAAATPIRYTVVWPVNCDPAEGVTWSMRLGSYGYVDQAGLYTPRLPLPPDNFVDVIDATTAGTPTCPATTVSAAVHYGAGEPGPPRNVAISPDGAEVSWSPPADDGGHPITGYVVIAVGDRSDAAGNEYVLGTAPGTATALPIPTDRIAEIEREHVQLAVTASNDRGQGPDSDLSPPPPSADLPLLLAARVLGGVSHEVIVTATIENYGPDDTTMTQLRISHPASFRPKHLPASCTVDTAADTVTCELGAVPAGTQRDTPIRFSASRLPTDATLTFTATRIASRPYATDPNDGSGTITCQLSHGHLDGCG